ncbi:hypothetical protein [Leuconostoc citreum]|uniref:hypothetical protein n=1 Tax=Leuconostoc citreum TaxID=33964 RepID=UPI0032E02CE1
MNKIKKNKLWLTVVGFGIVIVIILSLILLNQNKAKPESETTSFQSSVKASSSSQKNRDEENQKKYAEKAEKMKGHVFGIGTKAQFTNWNKQQFIEWAHQYSLLNEENKHNASTNFGTTTTISNDSLDTSALDEVAKSVISNDFKSISYFETVKDFNKAYPTVNPDDIKK